MRRFKGLSLTEVEIYKMARYHSIPDRSTEFRIITFCDQDEHPVHYYIDVKECFEQHDYPLYRGLFGFTPDEFREMVLKMEEYL